MSVRLRTVLRKIPLVVVLKQSMTTKMLQLRSRSRWKKLSREQVIKLELGAGRKKGGNGWTTVDITGADINHDLRRGIPLGDESVDVIYTSHLLEHLPYPHLITFLGECRRVLKSDGQFSVCVPDMGSYIKSYVERTNFRTVETMYGPAVVDTGSSMDQINYVAYMGGHHHYMFDEENLINTLKNGGFSRPQARSFDPEVDMEERDAESIYAVAMK